MVYHGTFELEAPSSSNCILHVNYVPSIWYVKKQRTPPWFPGIFCLWKHREPAGKLAHCEVLSAAL